MNNMYNIAIVGCLSDLQPNETEEQNIMEIISPYLCDLQSENQIREICQRILQSLFPQSDPTNMSKVSLFCFESWIEWR